jgi:hypothetical protein
VTDSTDGSDATDTADGTTTEAEADKAGKGDEDIDNGEDAVIIPIDDWERVLANAERFAGERGEVAETDTGVTCGFGNARVEIRRDGRVNAGMPLHDVTNAEADRLRFEHANGALVAIGGERRDDDRDGGSGEDDRFTYTFRRP